MAFDSKEPVDACRARYRVPGRSAIASPVGDTGVSLGSGRITNFVMAPRVHGASRLDPRWRLTRRNRSKVSMLLTRVSKSVVFPMFLGLVILTIANGPEIGYTNEKTGNSAIHKSRFYYPHNPLVTCSNHVGPIGNYQANRW